MIYLNWVSNIVQNFGSSSTNGHETTFAAVAAYMKAAVTSKTFNMRSHCRDKADLLHYGLKNDQKEEMMKRWKKDKEVIIVPKYRIFM